MYLTHEELCQAADYMIATYEATPKWKIVTRTRLKHQIQTVEGLIAWIEERMKAEIQDDPRCTCGQPHIDERLN